MILHRLSVGIAVTMSLGIILIGTRFLLTPEASAVGFGVPDPDGVGAYLAVKGVRDIASGLVGLGLLAARRWREAGWVVLALSFVPFGDMLIVLAWEGSPVLAYAMHGGTGAVMVLVGAVLLFGGRGGRRPSPGSPDAVTAESAPARG